MCFVLADSNFSPNRRSRVLCLGAKSFSILSAAFALAPVLPIFMTFLKVCVSPGDFCQVPQAERGLCGRNTQLFYAHKTLHRRYFSRLWPKENKTYADVRIERRRFTKVRRRNHRSRVTLHARNTVRREKYNAAVFTIAESASTGSSPV